MKNVPSNDKLSQSDSVNMGFSGPSSFIEIPTTNKAPFINLPRLRLNGELISESPQSGLISNHSNLPFKLNFGVGNKSPDAFFSIENIGRGFFESPLPYLKSPSAVPIIQGARLPAKNSSVLDWNKEFLFNTSSISPGIGRPKTEFFPEKARESKLVQEEANKFLTFASRKIAHLGSLYNLLTKIYIPISTIEEIDLRLTPIERVLLINLLNRKNPNLVEMLNPKSQNFDPDALMRAIENLRKSKSVKRIEERKKFVYKNVLKNLRKIATTEIELQNTQLKLTPSMAFKRYYFEDFTESSDMTIDHFIDPLNASNKDRAFKTLSKDFFKELFKNTRLYNDFFAYLESPDFAKDYQKKIQKKIEKLLVRWEALLKKETAEEVIFSRIEEYFKNNKQCKLPWSSNEISHAVESFKKFAGKLKKLNSG
jgi:hypothetical protein